jgi:hypothetical protein
MGTGRWIKVAGVLDLHGNAGSCKSLSAKVASRARRFDFLIAPFSRVALCERELAMDPITAAIVAVLPALASDVVKSGVKDAYNGLKAVIQRKWGGEAPITNALSALEKDPKSKAQAAVLEEKVGDVKATEDAEVAQALHRLVEEMKKNKIGGEAVAQIQFTMTGGVVQGVAGAGTVNVQTMNFGTPPKEDETKK